jgi:ELWxxDGT repeat protein
MAPSARTQAPATLLRDIRPGTSSSDILGFAEMGGRLFFSARQGPYAVWDLFVTDGTPVGTQALTQSSTVQVANGVPVAVGPDLYFVGHTTAQGDEIWKSDGTPAGTQRVTDLNPGPTGAYAEQLTSWRGYLWFMANAPLGNNGLWRSDGTATGTVQVLQISSMRNLVVAAGKLFFVGIDAGNGDELWVVDDPMSTPRLVRDIRPGGLGSNIGELIEWHGKVWFNANDGVHGHELWSSDGTTAGTMLAADVAPGAASSRPAIFTPTTNYLFFITADLSQTPYLWQTDGTQAGTQLVPNAQPLIGAAGPSAIGAVGDVVYARAATQIASPTVDLWRMDGSANGTVRVRGSNPNQALLPVHLRGVGSRYVYFEGQDSASGVELWRSDGTQQGTTLACDLVAGPGSSMPYELHALGGNLVFLATSTTAGVEPFAVPLDAHGQAIGSPCGTPARATTITSTDPVLGQTFTLSGRNAMPGSAGFLYWGSPAPGPIAVGFGICRLYEPQNGLNFLSTVVASGTTWSMQLTLPNLPALQHFLVRIQGIFAPTDAPPGFDITNAANGNFGY